MISPIVPAQFEDRRSVQISKFVLGAFTFVLALVAIGLSVRTERNINRVEVSGSAVVSPDDRTNVGPVVRVTIANDGQKAIRVDSARVSLRGQKAVLATGWLDTLRGLASGRVSDYWTMPISVGSGSQRVVGLVLDDDKRPVEAIESAIKRRTDRSRPNTLHLDIALSVDGNIIMIDGATLAAPRARWRVRAAERGRHGPWLDVVRPSEYIGKGVVRLTIWSAQGTGQVTRLSQPVLQTRVASFNLGQLARGNYNWTVDVSGLKVGSGRGRIPCRNRCKRIWRDRSITRPTEIRLPPVRASNDSTASPPLVEEGDSAFQDFCRDNPSAGPPC
jgi:hypothetical protein